MFLHLGNGVRLHKKHLVGIFDLDNCSKERDTLDFLRAAEGRGRIVSTGGGLPKAMVVSYEAEKDTVWLTGISARTLHRRAMGGK